MSIPATGFPTGSYDLDFVIRMPCDATRAERSRQAAGVKKAVGELVKQLKGFRVVESLAGANRSTQYAATRSHGPDCLGHSATARRALTGRKCRAPAFFDERKLRRNGTRPAVRASGGREEARLWPVVGQHISETVLS